MNYLISILIIFLLSMPAMAADAYLCITEHSAGMGYDVENRDWYPTFFNSGIKYVVRKVKNKNHTWEIRKMGANDIFSHCKKDINANGYLLCGGVEPTDFPFTMNIQMLRFVIASEGSYAAHKKSYDEYEHKGEVSHPNVTIGTCSPI